MEGGHLQIEELIKVLLSASPIVLALLALCLLIAVLYKTVPFLLKARREQREFARASYTLSDPPPWATTTRVEAIAKRMHDVSGQVGAAITLVGKVERLEGEMRGEFTAIRAEAKADVGKIHKRIDDHIQDDIVTHAREGMEDAEKGERIATLEGQMREITELRKDVGVITGDIKLILMKLGER